MSAFSNYLERKILDHVLGKGLASYTSPSQVYIGLFSDTAAPGDNGPQVELVSGGYSRQAITFAPASENAGTMSAKNSVDINFGPALETWPTVTYIGLYDSSTGGNCLFYGSLSSSVTVGAQNTFTILTGGLTINLD